MLWEGQSLIKISTSLLKAYYQGGLKMCNPIKNRLKELNLSQNEVSRLARVPTSSLSLITNGKLFPPPSWRRRISEVLQIPEEVLFSEYLKW